MKFNYSKHSIALRFFIL